MAATVDNYLEQFARLEPELGSGGGEWFQPVRRAALARFAGLGFPTTRMEDWRFTSVAGIAATPFAPAAAVSASPVDPSALDEFAFTGSGGGARLVFVNGRLAPELSRAAAPRAGVTIGSLAALMGPARERLEPHLGRHAGEHANAFAALNTASFVDGAFIHVDRGTVVEEPVHVVHLALPNGQPAVAHARTLVVVGENSQASVVECYAGPRGGGTPYFTNAVTEIAAGESAVLEHCKLQFEGAGAYHVATVQARQARASTLLTHSFSVGAALARNDVNMLLADQGAECTLNGLYLAAGKQHVDHHTQVDHAMPHCNSHEFYHGILDGESRGVFNGKIVVRQDAQKTDARQTNRNLLLSDDAWINTKPQLEIFADDVKCTHGATVGQLDEEAVFYMRARGIGRAEARQMLTYAFAGDIIARVGIESVRARLDELLLAWLRREGAREVPR